LQSVTVSGRPGRRARRLRPDPEARAVERADRPATRGDGVDAHHRRAQPDPGDFGHERPFEIAGPVRDIGGRAAHVEADDPVEAGLPRHLDRTDDAARGSGQDGVLALEEPGIGQAAARLHELQANAGIVTPAGQFPFDLQDIAPQDRRQVGIDHRGITARNELHQRTDFVRHRDLREADRARKRCQHLLMRRIPIAVHQHDCHCPDAVGPGRTQTRCGRFEVQGRHQLTVRTHAFVHLDHAFEEHRRQLDLPHEQFRAVLVGDAQRVGEAPGDQQRRALPLAFEQRVGGNRRAHLHRGDDMRGNRRT